MHGAELSLCTQCEPTCVSDRSTACGEMQERIAKPHDRGNGRIGRDADCSHERLSEIRDGNREAVRLCGDVGRIVGQLSGHPLEICDR